MRDIYYVFFIYNNYFHVKTKYHKNMKYYKWNIQDKLQLIEHDQFWMKRKYLKL